MVFISRPALSFIEMIFVLSETAFKTASFENLTFLPALNLTAFSDSDPITRGGDKFWQENVPGAQGQKYTTIRNAGHFVQEDRGPELAEIIIEFIKNNP